MPAVCGWQERGARWRAWLRCRPFPAAVLVGMVFSTGLVVQSTAAVFTATTSSSISFTAGTWGYAGEVLADAPVSYWRLGESTGTTAADAKGGRNGTYVNGPVLGVAGALVGDSDKAATFDGTNDRVEVPYTAVLNPATFTLEAWAKASTTAGFKTVMSSWTNDGTAAGFGIWAYGANWEFYLAHGTGSQSVAAPITANTWTHIAATYDGTTMRLYTDGQLRSAQTGGYVPNTSSPFSIGGATYVGSNWQHFLNGSVDEVAIYNTALPQARIQAHYNASR